MVSDDGLRAALATRVEHLDPDVEAELDALLGRATRRRVARAAAYVVGVAAAVTMLSVYAAHDWRTVETPDPVDQTPFHAQVLMPRGTYADPSPVEAGPTHVAFGSGPVLTPYLEVDVPEGWSQDDDMVLTTGIGGARTTLRIELSGNVKAVFPEPCRGRRQAVGPGVDDLATALAGMKVVSTGPPTPVTLDGHGGYQVRLTVPSGFDPTTCKGGWLGLYQNGAWTKGYAVKGWTSLIWVLDVDGYRLVIDACYGPEATPEEVEGLVHMVETARFVAPPD